MLRSSVAVEAGRWHRVSVERRLRDGALVVDAEPEVVGEASGATRGLNIRTNIYFAGVDSEETAGCIEAASLFTA